MSDTGQSSQSWPVSFLIDLRLCIRRVNKHGASPKSLGPKNGLEIAACPFANLPEARSGRWGQGLTADKMKECRWLKPVLVAQFEYVEWTPGKLIDN